MVDGVDDPQALPTPKDRPVSSFTPSAPAPGIVENNPFAQGNAGVTAQAVDQAGDLLACFTSLAPQLHASILGKLRELDPTIALITLKNAKTGKTTAPQPLAFFVADFAAEAAEMLGAGGIVFVNVNPNDGRGKTWGFAFTAPAPTNGQVQSAERVLLDAVIVEMRQMREDFKLQMALATAGGSGGSLQDKIAEWKAIGDALKTGQADPFQMMNSMLAGVGNVLTGVGAFQKQAGAMAAKAAEPSIGQTIKEVVGGLKDASEIPGVGDAMRGAVQGVFNRGAAAPLAPGAVNDNPFAKAAIA